jgi:hypothetical protein
MLHSSPHASRLLPCVASRVDNPKTGIRRFRVQVEMVSLPVAVTDREGSHVKNLRPDDSIAILSLADHVKLLEQFSIYREKNPEAIWRVRPVGLRAVYEGVWFACRVR